MRPIILTICLLAACGTSDAATHNPAGSQSECIIPRSGNGNPELEGPVDAADIAAVLDDCGPDGGKPIYVTWTKLLGDDAPMQFFSMDLSAYTTQAIATCIEDRLIKLGAVDIPDTGGDETGNGTTTK
jgi:hypothetical protein